jgi:antitoxin PrlF
MHKAKYTGKITSKGQTTVPKEVRDFLGLEEGTQMEWIVDDGKVSVKPRKLRAADLVGILGPSPVGPVSIEEMHEAVVEAAVARFERAVKR